METLSESKDTAAGSEDDLVHHAYMYIKDSANPKQLHELKKDLHRIVHVLEEDFMLE